MESKLSLLLEKIRLDIKLGQFEAALQTLHVNRDAFFAFQPAATIDLHVGILLELKDFSQALKAIVEYREKPYVSQAVEALLTQKEADINREIAKMAKRDQLDEDKWLSRLNSERFEDVLHALTQLKNLSVSPTQYQQEISDALSRDYGFNVAYILLNEIYQLFPSTTFYVNYYGKLIKIKTNAFFLLDTHPSIRAFLKYLDAFNKHTTVHRFARQLGLQKAIELFPYTYDELDVRSLAIYFIYRARLALQEAFDQQQFFKENGVSPEILKKIVKKYHLDMYQG